MRWSLLLQKFDIEVEYISGKANVLADFKSRMPLKQLKGMIDSDAFDLSREVPATSAILQPTTSGNRTSTASWPPRRTRSVASLKDQVLSATDAVSVGTFNVQDCPTPLLSSGIVKVVRTSSRSTICGI